MRLLAALGVPDLVEVKSVVRQLRLRPSLLPSKMVIPQPLAPWLFRHQSDWRPPRHASNGVAKAPLLIAWGGDPSSPSNYATNGVATPQLGDAASGGGIKGPSHSSPAANDSRAW